jgi:hypothetical protein
MKQNTKDWIRHSAALALIVSSITMAFLCLALTLEIGGGPLTYIGESLSAALALFGIGVFADGKVNDIRRDLLTRYENDRKKEEE